MPAPWGLVSTGFNTKPLAAIVADINDAMLNLVSPSLDVQPTAIMGVIIGIFSGELALAWQAVGAVYNGMDADQAVDDQLDGLALLTGTLRQPATATVIEGVQLTVGAGFDALPGTMFATVVGNPVDLFYNLDAVSSVGGGVVTSDFICQNTGAVQALAGTLTVIAQPLSGWTAVTNPADGLAGSPIQTNSQLRIVRTEELQSAGAATADAIQSAVLLQMQPPTTTVATTAVTVLFNDTETTDANGLPPHCIEVIARAEGATSGDNQLLCNLIATEKTAGDGTYSGNGTSETVTDSQGNVDTIYYTRPTDVTLTVSLTITVNSNYPSDGDTQVQAALVGYAMGNATTGQSPQYEPGVEVFSLQLVSQAFTVPGVEDITAYLVNGSTANIPMDPRHVATLSTGGITVTS